MQIRAIRIGQRLDIRKMQAELGFRQSYKDPFVLEYAKGKYIVFFRYGTVVFWNCSDGEINEIFTKISDFLTERFETPQEETGEVVLRAKKDEIRDGKIRLAGLNIPKIALVSVVLSRSIAMDNFEDQVTTVLKELDIVMKSFAAKGTTTLSTRELLKKVGFAMNMQHLAVHQMALLDRPSVTWEYDFLNQFYNDLVEEYELDERYEILNNKLQILFRSVEFILGYIDARRSLLLELTIVFLIVFEIVIFLYEQFFR